MKLIGLRNLRHLNKYEDYLNSGVINKNIGRPQLNIKGLRMGQEELPSSPDFESSIVEEHST